MHPNPIIEYSLSFVAVVLLVLATIHATKNNKED